MPTCDKFLFNNYSFTPESGRLRLSYAYESGPAFEEFITFPVPDKGLSTGQKAALDRVFRFLFLIAGISYFKAYVPARLVCLPFVPDGETAAFFRKVTLGGLGEFAYRNGIDLSDKLILESGGERADSAVSLPASARLLVPVGGGKDSVVSIECLKKAGQAIALFALGGEASLAEPIRQTAAAANVPLVRVTRALSPVLFDLNKKDALNGHVPITAILSCIAAATAIMHGFGAVVLSNEGSASAPNLVSGGVEINHQYSKSFSFERDFASYIKTHITPDVAYFSLLRPLTESAIAKRFARHEAYHPVFRSCNAAFRQDEALRATNWCCDCPKCRFVFLALAPFMEKEKLIRIFGRNLLNDETQRDGFAALCGIEAFKPFECVGTVEESALLMERLWRDERWRDDVVVASLGEKVSGAAETFDDRFARLFERSDVHALSDSFLRMLDADR